MKKTIILILSLFLMGSVVFAAESQGTKQQSGQQSQFTTGETATTTEDENIQGEDAPIGAKGSQGTGETQETQTRTQAEEETQSATPTGETITVRVRARTVTELKQMIQVKQQEMQVEVESLEETVTQQVFENQNKVRAAVHSLLAMEDLAKGIGPQVSQIAQEFNNSVQATVMAEEKIQKRSNFVKFFLGGDQESAEAIEQEVNQNMEKIQELKQLREDCDCGEEIKTIIQEQVQNMEEEQNRLQEVAEKEKASKGIFGWIKNLFRWGR